MEPVKRRKKKTIQQEEVIIIPEGSYEHPGVEKIIVSEKTQKVLEIECGKYITIEKEWKLVNKQTLLDYIDTDSETSEFLPILQQIQTYPGEEILFVYIAEDGAENDKFYVCTTPECRSAVEIAIEFNKQKLITHLKSIIYKTPGKWKNLGSDIEVDEMIEDTQSKPLLQIEVDAKFPPCEEQPRFHERNVEDVLDGYMELTHCNRFEYDLVYKKRVDASVQVTAKNILIEAQTEPRYPTNTWTQYEYKIKPPEEGKKKRDISEEPNVNDFLNESRVNGINHEIVYNECVELYNNDLKDLKVAASVTDPIKMDLKEIHSFSNISPKEKMITCAAWHPMWTGICAVAYADTAPSTQRDKFQRFPDEVLSAVHEPNYVYIWSITDDLNPKLILECNREVLKISFCPHNENILVGGCINGQTVIWDLKNKLSKVEQDEVLTVAQQNYRTHLFSLMHWFKNTKNDALVPATIMSSLMYSHTNSVRGIDWLHPRLSIDRCGKISQIPCNEESSLQFLTCAQDSLILIWDLNYYPPLGRNEEARLKSKQIMIRRPSKLTSDVSELTKLNKIFRPIFEISVNRLDKRPLPLISACFINDVIEYRPRNPLVSTKHSLYKRVIYEPIITESSDKNHQVVAGLSIEGDFFIAKWDGLNIDSGLPVNKETCLFTSIEKRHNGIGLTLSKSPFYSDIFLTVGEKSLCIWQESFENRPLTRKISKEKYTMGIWSPFKEWSFIISRQDGTIEIWDLLNRTHSPTYEVNFSGKPLSGIYIHPIQVINNVIGIAEESRHFRIFHIPDYLVKRNPTAKTYNDLMVEKVKFRKLTIQEWENNWFKEHEQRLKREREEKEEELNRIERELEHERVRQENERLKQEELYMKHKQSSEKPQPGKFSEWAHAKWMEKQQGRVHQLLIAKKKLNQNDLIMKQEPLKRFIEQEKNKKEKQRQTLSQKDQIFNDVVNKMISQISRKYIRHRSRSIEFESEQKNTLKQICINQYDEIENDLQEYIKQHPHEYKFDWQSFQIETLKRHKNITAELIGLQKRTKILRKSTMPKVSLKKSSQTVDPPYTPIEERISIIQ